MAFDPIAWAGCVIMALVAAMVVRAYRETSTGKALVLGAAAPSIVLGLAAGAAGPGPTGAEGRERGAWLDGFSPGALFAQETPAQTQDPETPSDVWVSLPGLAGVLPSGLPPTLEIEWLIAPEGGDNLGREEGFRQTYLVPESGYFMISIPEGAEDINVSVAGVTSNGLSIIDLRRSRGDSLSFSVERGSPSVWSRVLRPFGTCQRQWDTDGD